MQCIVKKGFGDKYITKIGQVCRIKEILNVRTLPEFATNIVDN